MSLRPFLDANILFTAAYSPKGLARLLFDLHKAKAVSLFTSDLAVEEARVNLEIKRPAALDDLTILLRRLKVVRTPSRSPINLELPSKDLSIFSAAVSGNASHLLTGDKKHFKPYFNKPRQTGGMLVQTVREFLVQNFGLNPNRP